PEHRKKDLRIQGPPLGEMWHALFGPIGFLLITAFMISFGITNFEGIFPYYTQERFGYTPQTIGLIMTVVGLVSAIAQGLLTGIATRAFGDSNVIKASLIGSAIGFLLMLSATSLTTILLTTAFFVLSNAMLRPATSALISKRATSGQGIAMGLNNAYMSLGRVLGPIWAGNVIDINLSLPFLSGAVIMFLGFIASLIYLHKEEVPAGATSPETSSAD
ncbi:MAG: MFS transporter, partial [Anaerolineae bacterium]